MTSPIVTVLGLTLIGAGGLFVLWRVFIKGREGTGTGGVVGKPKPPQDPLGNMKPKGTGTGTVKPPPGELL